METILLTISFSFLFTVFTIPIIISIAHRNGLVVKKSYRKIHKGEVSSLGGIAIFIPVILSLFFFSDFINIKEIKYLLFASSMIFVFGLRDDLLEVGPFQKFIGQIITVAILVFLANIRLESFDGLFGVQVLPYWLSVIITFLLIILIINAFNFFDGIDLQASLVAIIVLFTLGIWFYRTGQFDMGMVLISTGASLVAFSIYNISPAKIFMGDTGAMSIGLIIAISVIKFINLNSTENIADSIDNEVVVGLSFMAIPLFDALRVSIIRLSRGRSPFRGDKNHIHHLLLRLGLKQNHIAILNGGLTMIFVLLNIYLQSVIKSEIQLVINIILLLALFTTVEVLIKKKGGN